MNEKPTINWKWDAEHGILNIISSGDGYVLLEVDDSIFETGEDKALCSIKSAVGKTHQARACNSKNGSIVSEWAESTFLVPAAGDSSESEPNDSEEAGKDDNDAGDGNEHSLKSSKYLEVKSLLERALVSLMLQKPASEFFSEESKNFSSMNEKNMSSLNDESQE